MTSVRKEILNGYQVSGLPCDGRWFVVIMEMGTGRVILAGWTPEFWTWGDVLTLVK